MIEDADLRSMHSKLLYGLMLAAQNEGANSTPLHGERTALY